MDQTRAPWRSRIVGHADVCPDQLLANPSNWRIHPERQQHALRGVLDQVGWVTGIIVNQRTGCVVDGHLRVALALTRHEPLVPVTYVDLAPEEERLILATLDPLTALAEADAAQLGQLLAQVHAEDAATADLLKDLALTAANPATTDVSFTVEERPVCPTCGQKLRKCHALEAVKA